MKKTILLGMFLIAGTTLGFAKTSTPVNKNDSSKTIVSEYSSKSNEDAKSSCTVNVTTGGYNVTITVTCACTQKQACDKAYALASLGV